MNGSVLLLLLLLLLLLYGFNDVWVEIVNGRTGFVRFYSIRGNVA